MADTGAAVVAESADPGVARYAGWRRWRWWLLGLLVLTQLVSVVAFSSAAGPDDLLTDLTAGRVRSVEVGRFEFDPATDMLLGWQEKQATSAAGVRWTTTTGLRYQTDLTGVDGPEARGPFGRLDVPATVRATAAAAGVEAPRVAHSDGGPEQESGGAVGGLLVWAAAVLLLMIGPQPRRFTRWGTFWLLCLPAGAGIAWWLLREAPWSRRTSVEPAPPGNQRVPGVRRGGWSGLFLLIVLTALLEALLRAGVPALLDLHWGGTGVWHLVDATGREVTVHQP